MEERTWIRHMDQTNKYAATFTLGEREMELPDEFFVSLTAGVNFNIWRILVNGIITQFIIKQLAKDRDLLYGELSGALGSDNLTMTVWKQAKDMTRFRDSGAHKFAIRFFSWVFYSGKVQSYFLTYKTKGKIPTRDEALEIAKTYGRHFDGGKLIRQALKPE